MNFSPQLKKFQFFAPNLEVFENLPKICLTQIDQKFDFRAKITLFLISAIIDEGNSEIAAWAAIICAVLGGVGNILTIFVLLKKRDLRIHSTTPFLLSLALSDLIFCVFNLPLTAVRFFERGWIFPLWTCKLFPFFFYANISISAFSMAFVALNRYVGVYHGESENMMDKWFSRWRSVSYIGLIWALSFGE